MDNGSNSWTGKRKRDLVLDIIQGKSTASEASRFYDLHPSTLEEWVENATQAMDDALQTPTSHEVYERIEALSKRVADVFEVDVSFEITKRWVEHLLSQGLKGMPLTANFAESASDDQSRSRGCEEYLAIACAHYLEGKQFLEKNNLRFAQGEFEWASRACNTVEEKLQSTLDGSYVTLEDYEKEGADRATEKARMAGQARSEKRYGPMKRKFARLLSEKKPDGGWKSKAQVVRLLEADMTESKPSSQDGHTLPLTPDNLHRTLAKWMREDTEIREAYANTRRLPVQS